MQLPTPAALLVGEDNPYSLDPQYALYPEPTGASGDRLCRFVMGMDHDAYLERFARVNLIPAGRWSTRSARANVPLLLALDRFRQIPTLVLLGVKVARAFGFDPSPFTVRSLPDGRSALLLPHPSGLCRVWHEPGAVSRARELLREHRCLPGAK